MGNPLSGGMKRAQRIEWLVIVGSIAVLLVVMAWRFIWYFDMQRRPIVSLYNEWGRNGFPVDVCEVSKQPYPIWNRTTATPLGDGELQSFVTKNLQERLRVGQRAFVDQGDASLPATVSSVSAARDMENGLYEVRLRPDERGAPTGSPYYNVRINTDTIPDAIALPIEVVRDGSDGSFVWIVEDGVARTRRIEKVFSDGVHTLVRNNLSSGDLLIIVGFNRLDEGARVDIEKRSACFSLGDGND